MMIKLIKAKDKYRFSRNDIYLKTLSGRFLEVKKRKHAETFIEELLVEGKLIDPYSLVNLTFFSCNLEKKDVVEIKKKILELINFDFILYRSFDDRALKSLMEKKFSRFINDFEDKFHLKLTISNSISEYNKVDSLSFQNFLNKLDDFQLTTLYKLSSLTKSVILSYFFINQKINYNTLYKLSNLEYTYQQKQWGVVNEQKEIDKNFLKIIKNISFFFKNTN